MKQVYVVIPKFESLLLDFALQWKLEEQELHDVIDVINKVLVAGFGTRCHFGLCLCVVQSTRCVTVNWLLVDFTIY